LLLDVDACVGVVGGCGWFWVWVTVCEDRSSFFQN